jgi:hypothetical protein
LWRSKAYIDWEIAEATHGEEELRETSLPLNPLDLPIEQLAAFDLISMPPSSLVDYATLSSKWWMAETSKGKFYIPNGLAYTFPEGVA